MGSKYLNFSLELLKGLSLGLLLSKIIIGYLSFGLFYCLLCFFRLWLRGLLFSRRSCRFWSCLGYQLLFLLHLRLSFLWVVRLRSFLFWFDMFFLFWFYMFLLSVPLTGGRLHLIEMLLKFNKISIFINNSLNIVEVTLQYFQNISIIG